MDSQELRKRWLKQHFNANGAEVKAFAEKVKIDRTSMSLMLSGDRDISDRTIYRVCGRLSVAPPEGMIGLPEKSNTSKHEPIPGQETMADVDAALADANERVKNMEKLALFAAAQAIEMREYLADLRAENARLRTELEAARAK